MTADGYTIWLTADGYTIWMTVAMCSKKVFTDPESSSG